jgi:hypothetical protein
VLAFTILEDLLVKKPVLKKFANQLNKLIKAKSKTFLPLCFFLF